MHKIVRLFIYTFLVAGLSSLMISCEDTADSASGSSGGGGSPIDDIPVGSVDATGFWVNINTDDQFPALINKRNSFGDDCWIDADTTGYEYLCG